MHAFGDLSTVRECFDLYGAPIEQKLIRKHGYPNLEMHPFDFRTSLENAVFKCDDVAAEVLLRELTSAQTYACRRKESLLVIEAVHRNLLEDCEGNPDAGKFGEIIYLLNKSIQTLQLPAKRMI